MTCNVADNKVGSQTYLQLQMLIPCPVDLYLSDLLIIT